MEQRTLLREVPSGRIETVWNGLLLTIEMNCSCLDALPICKGMCCRYRAGYSVELERDELHKYSHRGHPSKPGVYILASKKDGLSCVYLDEEKGLCTIHQNKPKMCQQWHCSPQGEKDDTGITDRDAGWVLMPMRHEEARLIQIQFSKGESTI